MLTRRNCMLLGLLLVLVALEGSSRVAGIRSARGAELFPGFVPEEVGAILIESAEESVHLDRKAGLWVVRERQDFFAEKYLVETLLKRLPDLTSADEVASEENSQRLYGLGQDRIHIQLQSLGGEPLLGFHLGRPPSETKGSYILPDGQNSIYRAAALGLPQLDPALWLNLHVIAGFDMTEVLRMELGFGDGRKLNLQRLENGRWNAVGLERSIAPQQVQHLMSYAMNAVLRDITLVDRTTAGLELPALSLSLFLESGVRRLDLGGPLGNGRAVSSPDWGSEWVAEVPLSTGQSLEITAELIYQGLNPK